MADMSSAGSRFRAALQAEKPLQIVGVINGYAASWLAFWFQSALLAGAGVASASLGVPDLGISTLDDVLTDVRRITDASQLPLLVDADTGWGGAFNIARAVKSLSKFGAAAVHIEDQVAAKRCGHRPNKEIVSRGEMTDRIKAAADAKTDPAFVVIARTDALAVEGIDSAIDRLCACVEAGADMVFPEAVTDLAMYKRFASATKAPVLANITEFGVTPLYPRRTPSRGCFACSVSSVGFQSHERRGDKGLCDVACGRNPEKRAGFNADQKRALRRARLSRLRAATGSSFRREESRRPQEIARRRNRSGAGSNSIGANKIRFSIRLSECPSTVLRVGPFSFPASNSSF